MHFARVEVDRLRRLSFLDGRDLVGEPGPTVAVSALARALGDKPLPLPMIFHVSFCRSTLLSRMLDIPGHSIVYREPAIQIELADRHVQGIAVDKALAVATALLGRPIDGARAVVKPTNWANVLIPVWMRAGDILPIFITMTPRRFLTAVFRGGRDRIAFTIRAAEHFARVVPEGASWLAAAVAIDRDPLAQAARLALVALACQLQIFSAAHEGLEPDACRIIDEQDIASDPTAAAGWAARALGLDTLIPFIGDGSIAHAKDPGARFSEIAERQAGETIHGHYEGLFEAALAWAASLGPSPTYKTT